MFPGVGWDDSQMAAIVVGSSDEQELRAWADGQLDDVDQAQITLAMAAVADDARAERDAYDASDPDATFSRVDARFSNVTSEAVRRHAVMEAITGRASRTGTFETTGSKYDGAQWDATQIAKLVRADLKDVYAERLLPAGTTVRVGTRKFAGGQSINPTLCGIRDDQVTSELTLPTGITITERTPYAVALDRTLDRLVNSRNRQDVGSMTDYWDVHYYGNTAIESERAGEFREREAGKQKAKR